MASPYNLFLFARKKTNTYYHPSKTFANSLILSIMDALTLDVPNSVTCPSWTPIFEWNVVWCGFKKRILEIVHKRLDCVFKICLRMILYMA